MSEPYGKVYVPNEFKKDAAILIVGEAPGFDEEQEKRPFIGKSGELLWNAFGVDNISRDAVSVSNLCHYRPANNKFSTLIQTKALTDGIVEIATFIRANKPKVIAALGKFPTFYLTGKEPIHNYRGSILPCVFDPTIKVIPTFHPAFILRTPSQYPSFASDIQRIVEDSKYAEFNYPKWTFLYNKFGMELEDAVKKFENSEFLSVDIESVKNSTRLLCVGFAKSKTEALCIAPNSMQAEAAIRRLLLCEAKKIFHNGGAFDVEMLHINGYTVKNFHHDTMIGQRVQWPELPSSLAYLTSLYTREPYYKTEGRSNIPGDDDESGADNDTKSWSEKFDKDKLAIYNCKDVCVTYEIWEAQRLEIAADKSHKNTFEFEMGQLEIAREISRAGIFVDVSRRNKIKTSLLLEWMQAQQNLNNLANDKINVNSNPRIKVLLYDSLKLPERRVYQNGKSRVTCNDDALVGSISFAKDKAESMTTEGGKEKWERALKILSLIRQIRGIRKLLSSYILTEISNDGRVRSSYNVMGTETGRWSAAKYVDGTGVNAQTFPRGMVDMTELDIPISEELIAEVMNAEEDED